MTSQANVDKLQTAVGHHRRGELSQALRLYAQVLSDDPGNADAWHLTGLVSFARGDLTEAEFQIRHALNIRPETEFLANLAAVLVKQKKSAAAEETCRDILRKEPSNHAALTHLGTALRQQKRFGEALDTFRRANTIQSSGASLCNVGSALTDLGRFREAREILLDAQQRDPNRSQILLNLAVVERELGNSEQAFRLLDQAGLAGPQQAEVHTNRGNLFLAANKVPEAVDEYQQALRIDPRSSKAASRLGRALELAGEWDTALECHQAACTLSPHDHEFASSMLYSVSLNPRLTPDEVTQHHRRWGQRIESMVKPIASGFELLDGGKKRVGYVSPDIRNHATMRFLFPLLKSHDREEFEVFVYSETAKEDTTTDSIRSITDGWCHTKPLSDEQLAQKIRDDRIDVLVDLAGHTAENRLPVFARRPAPIQVSFLGYPATTGLSRIDYFFTDHIREPDGGQRYFAEEPYLLPHGACCFEVVNAPAESPPPSVSNGYTTLGSTHRIEKLSSAAIALWVRTLNAIPNARLLILRDALESESLREQLTERLIEAGADMQRITLDWQLPDSHFDVYSQIDILLDVFPWGSGTTAYESMWMGVPIPTIAGDRGGCRATASLMHFCGFPELVARNEDEYVDIVAGLADDRARLAELRNCFRSAMTHTVCNGDRFARDVEAAYRVFCERYLQTTKRPEESLT